LRALACFAVAALSLATRSASASDGGDPQCQGPHSIVVPVPDACLEVIDTDRPHQTDTPHVVPAGHVQIESALASVQLGGVLDDPSGDRTAHVVLLDDSYEFGLLTDVELQLFFTHAAFDPAEGKLLAPGPGGVRAKLSVVKEQGWVPAITLVPWVFIPVAPTQSLRAGPYVFLAKELSSRFELEVNAGVLFGASPKPPAAIVLASALTYKVVGEFSVFVDIYTTGPDAALGTGALWAFARDMQIDLGTYVGVHGDEPVATPFLGFSIRR
jgi:hypothetical protein